MKKFTVLILFTILFVSCDIMKQSSKSKTDTELKQNYEQTEKRDGGNAIFIPQTNTVYKDTIIYVQGTNGTDLKIIYDKQGNFQAADCNGALIDIITKYNSNLSQQVKEKEKEKTEEFSDTWVLYVMGGVVFIVALGMFLMYKSLNKNSKAIEAILNKLS